MYHHSAVPFHHSNELAHAIDKAIVSSWLDFRTPEDRAMKVLQVAADLGHQFPLVTFQMLGAAMAKHVYWRQGPSDYLDMAFALQAARRTMN